MNSGHGPGSVAWEILHRSQQHGWQDLDPYDGLAGVASILPQRAVMARRVLTQVVMRTSPRLRWTLGISPRRDAYSLGLLLSTACSLGTGALDEFADDLEAALSDLRVKGTAGWGYGFPVVTRAAQYGPDTPNLISTAFAGLGLLDFIEVGGDVVAARGMVKETADWVVSSLWDEQMDGFRYHAGNREFIYNASILGACLVARASSLLGKGDMVVAKRAVGRVIQAIRDDGSWPYGAGPRLDWVDNHHTAFILKALLLLPKPARPPRWAEAVDRGLAYFAQHLVAEDGAPLPTPGRRYPLDSLAAGQTVETLTLAAAVTGDSRFARLSGSVFAWSEVNLRRADDRYRFRQGRFLPWPGAYLRWGEAHIALGAARLSEFRTHGSL